MNPRKARVPHVNVRRPIEASGVGTVILGACWIQSVRAMVVLDVVGVGADAWWRKRRSYF
jgi:hypothetical protein